MTRRSSPGKTELADIKKRLLHLEKENAKLRLQRAPNNNGEEPRRRQRKPSSDGKQRQRLQTLKAPSAWAAAPLRNQTSEEKPDDDDDENEEKNEGTLFLIICLERHLGPETRSVHRGRNIWVGGDHRSLQVSHELLGAALPDAVRGFPVTIFAKYEDNVNTAIKGCAIAAERLREKGRLVAVEPSFRENRNELTFKVIDISQISEDDDSDAALTVASATDYKILGGAVAMRLRDEKATLLRAIGKRAVWAATRALAVANEYIRDDPGDNNLLFAPKFNSVQLPNRREPSTVVELYVTPLHSTKNDDKNYTKTYLEQQASLEHNKKKKQQTSSSSDDDESDNDQNNNDQNDNDQNTNNNNTDPLTCRHDD